jgi:hypothetical protein
MPLDDRCFESSDALTEYEQWVDWLYELTGMCHCNLCHALKINGWKNREDADDD